GPSRRDFGALFFAIVVVLQTLCAAFFVYDIFAGVIGIRTEPLSWRAHELIQLSATVGLVAGIGLAVLALRSANLQRRAAEDRLAEVTGAFHELIETRFAEWRLTPAERDVAFFVMKGFTTAEIAGLRETSEGTVKAQTAAIYRKAGVSGRAQLVSHFIEDLLGEGLAAA
ncbi:MAG: LuxR C-terminal-related transcriptional regulator, partial [Pseudomonadota bacterium]